MRTYEEMAVAICDPVGDHESERMLGARLDGRPADSEKRTGLSGLKVGLKRSFLSGREVLGAVAAMCAGILKREWQRACCATIVAWREAQDVCGSERARHKYVVEEALNGRLQSSFATAAAHAEVLHTRYEPYISTIQTIRGCPVTMGGFA